MMVGEEEKVKNLIPTPYSEIYVLKKTANIQNMKEIEEQYVIYYR